MSILRSKSSATLRSLRSNSSVTLRSLRSRRLEVGRCSVCSLLTLRDARLRRAPQCDSLVGCILQRAITDNTSSVTMSILRSNSSVTLRSLRSTSSVTLRSLRSRRLEVGRCSLCSLLTLRDARLRRAPQCDSLVGVYFIKRNYTQHKQRHNEYSAKQ